MSLKLNTTVANIKSTIQYYYNILFSKYYYTTIKTNWHTYFLQNEQPYY